MLQDTKSVKAAMIASIGAARIINTTSAVMISAASVTLIGGIFGLYI